MHSYPSTNSQGNHAVQVPPPSLTVMLRCPDETTIPIVVSNNYPHSGTIGDLVQMIEQNTGVVSASQRLIVAGEELNDDHASLQDAGIVDRTSVLLQVR